MNNSSLETQSNHRLSPEYGFLRLEQILKLIPVDKTTWWNGVKSGRFPKPVKLGTRITAWKTEDIKNLINGFNKNELKSYATLPNSTSTTLPLVAAPSK